MLNYIWFIIYGIFYTTATLITFGKHNGKEKSVNLALETVFEFDEEDQRGDVNILSKVQKFIGKMKNVIENNNAGRRHLVEKDKNIFTNFVGNALRILKKYDDNDLEQFTSILSDEMKNRYYRDFKLHELTENVGVQNVIGSKLVEIKNKPAADIRRFLSEVSNKIEKEKYQKHEKELLDTINSIYTMDSVDKINSFLTNLDNYRLKARKNLDLSKIVSSGLKNLVYDYYSGLNVNLRSTLISKFQEFVQHLYNSLGQITAQPVYIQPTIKTTEAYNKMWKTSRTHKTRRPHNVPTTKRIPYEYDEDDDALRIHKKYRFSKVSKGYEQATLKHIKYKTETTDDARTMRQMYVEKNMDLKYDPDAYEHLTTKKKSKRDKSKKKNIDLPTYSPTTHKHVKTTRKRKEHNLSPKKRYTKDEDVWNDDDTDESNLNYNRKDNKLKEVMIQLSTEVHFPTLSEAPKKLTKMVRHFGNTIIDKNLEYTYDEQPEFKSNTRKLTFKTLYPTFVNDWSATKATHTKRNSPKHKVRIVKHGSAEDNEQLRRDAGFRDVVQAAKDLDITVEIKTERNLEGSRKSLQNVRHKLKHDIKYPSSSHREHSQKITRQRHENTPVLRHQDIPNLRGKVKISRDPLILAKRIRNLRTFSRNTYRRFYPHAPINSEEGLSIDRNNYMNLKMSNRRNENPDTVGNVADNKQVLRRLMKLENELELVKTQIKNDSSNLSPLNNDGKLSTPYSYNGKVTQIENIATNHNAKTDYDIVTTIETINAGGFKMEVPMVYKQLKSENPIKQSFDLSTDQGMRKAGANENSLKGDNAVGDYLSKTTNTLKENYTMNVLSNKIYSNRTFQKNVGDNVVDSKNKPVKDIIEKNAKGDTDVYLRTNEDVIDDNAINSTSFKGQFKNGTLGNPNKITINKEQGGGAVKEAFNRNNLKNNNSSDNINYRDDNLKHNNSMEQNTENIGPVFKSVDEFTNYLNDTQKIKDKTPKQDEPLKVDPRFSKIIGDVTNYSTNNQPTTVITSTSIINSDHLAKFIKDIGSHSRALPNIQEGNAVQNDGKKATVQVHQVLNTVVPVNINNETIYKKDISISSTIQHDSNVTTS